MNADIKQINELKAKSWNDAIMPRLEAVRSYLTADQWNKGVGAWLKDVDRQLTEKLKFGCKSREDDQFVRGQLAMLKEILDVPVVIDKIIAEQENQKKQANSRGPAGY